jgi:hypothetical protein
MPATLSAGATASYTVTLRNHSGAPLRLTPCPSYTEYLGVFSGPGRPLYLARHYYLNCAAIRRIAAHGSATFAMRIRVPAGAGHAKLDWQLQGTDVATTTSEHWRSDPLVTGANHWQAAMRQRTPGRLLWPPALRPGHRQVRLSHGFQHRQQSRG